MSRFALKILAIVTMLIDHIGAVLFPHVTILRIIGRLAFPIFAYLITEGMLHTSNIKKYLWRLFLFALISEIPFDLAFHGVFFYSKSQNVFFTLLIGLAAITVLHQYFARNPVVSVAFVIAAALFAQFLHTDYGWFGVAVVVLFYCFHNYRTWGVFAFALLVAGYSLMGGPLEIFALASGIPILIYNGKKGSLNWKYFFYAFYPVHLLLLYFVHIVAI